MHASVVITPHVMLHMYLMEELGHWIIYVQMALKSVKYKIKRTFPLFCFASLVSCSRCILLENRNPHFNFQAFHNDFILLI